MIHPLIIASNILDCTPDRWQILKFESDNTSWIINAKYNDTDINLLVVKSNDSEVKRIAKIAYDNLNIVMNVDLKKLSIGQASISISYKYKDNFLNDYSKEKYRRIADVIANNVAPVVDNQTMSIFNLDDIKNQ